MSLSLDLSRQSSTMHLVNLACSTPTPMACDVLISVSLWDLLTMLTASGESTFQQVELCASVGAFKLLTIFLLSGTGRLASPLVVHPISSTALSLTPRQSIVISRLVSRSLLHPFSVQRRVGSRGPLSSSLTCLPLLCPILLRQLRYLLPPPLLLSLIPLRILTSLPPHLPLPSYPLPLQLLLLLLL